MEILFCTVIFTICAFICVSLMVKASLKNSEAALLSYSVLECENVAECLKDGQDIRFKQAEGFNVVVMKDDENYEISAIDEQGLIIYQLEVRIDHE